jgi:periplasmic divalent cation tolerance protein
MFLESIKKESKDLVFVYTTCPTREEAMSIGLSSIENKLAISADYWLIESIYPWKGVIQQIGQYMLMLSSQKCLSDKLIEFVDKIHSYNTPMIVMCETSKINYPYKFWMDGLLMSKDKYLSEEEAKLRKIEEEEGVYHYGKLK